MDRPPVVSIQMEGDLPDWERSYEVVDKIDIKYKKLLLARATPTSSITQAWKSSPPFSSLAIGLVLSWVIEVFREERSRKSTIARLTAEIEDLELQMRERRERKGASGA